MKKTKIVSRKKENMTFKGFPTKFKEGITCLIASIILMYIALAGPADGLASYVGLGFSGVFMFLSIGFASTDMNVYKTMYSSYFAINALFLFSIFLMAKEYLLAALSLIIMFAFYKVIEWLLVRLQYHVGVIKVRGSQ